MNAYNFSSHPYQATKAPVYISILAILISLVFVGTSWGQTEDNSWSALADKANVQGSVQVIVQLTEDAPGISNFSSAQGRENRSNAMRDIQNNLVSAMQQQGQQMQRIKNFNFIPFMAMSVDSSTLSALKNSSLVAGIQEDKRKRATLSQSIPLIGADSVHNDGTTGSGWTVAILDTGVDKSHSFLGGRVVSEACYSSNVPGQNATSVCPGGVTQTTAPDSGLNWGIIYLLPKNPITFSASSPLRAPLYLGPLQAF